MLQQLVVRVLVPFGFDDDHTNPDLWLVLAQFQYGEYRGDRVCVVVEHEEQVLWCCSQNSMVDDFALFGKQSWRSGQSRPR